MLNLPAELGWVSENLPFGARLRLGPQGRFSLTHPRSAGRFIPDQYISITHVARTGKVPPLPHLLSFPPPECTLYSGLDDAVLSLSSPVSLAASMNKSYCSALPKNHLIHNLIPSLSSRWTQVTKLFKFYLILFNRLMKVQLGIKI